MHQAKIETVQKSIRPKFLAILCILSFIGGALMLLNYISSYFSYKAMDALNAESFLVMAAFGLITLAGVFLMWRLKKNGFWLYLTGQLASLIYPFATNTVDTVMGLLVLPLLITGILFIILYAINLKHMTA